jgi:imidazole glycerol-phosphate synthase subunit HisF
MYIRPRIIPCLLLKGKGLVKTIKFKDPVYLGDPINIVRIFNDKEVDELILLDILATSENRKPQFDYLHQVVSECFMPVCYGGGVNSLEDMRHLFKLGIEKISINSYAVENSAFIRNAANEFGSQSIVVSIDVKKDLFGKYEVYTMGGRQRTHLSPVDFASQVEEMGAGEIMINSIDRDGAMQGYDYELVHTVTEAVHLPVIACGGASSIEDLVGVIINGGAAAAAAGSLFVFQGKHRAVLISYPTSKNIDEFLDTQRKSTNDRDL